MDSGQHARPIISTEVAKILCMNSRRPTKRSIQMEVAKILCVDSRCPVRCSIGMDLLRGKDITFSFLRSDGSNKLTLCG